MYRLQWSWDPEDVSLLERCPHFRGCYVQASMELVSLLERCPHLNLEAFHDKFHYRHFEISLQAMGGLHMRHAGSTNHLQVGVKYLRVGL